MYSIYKGLYFVSRGLSMHSPAPGTQIGSWLVIHGHLYVRTPSIIHSLLFTVSSILPISESQAECVHRPPSDCLGKTRSDNRYLIVSSATRQPDRGQAPLHPQQALMAFRTTPLTRFCLHRTLRRFFLSKLPQ